MFDQAELLHARYPIAWALRFFIYDENYESLRNWIPTLNDTDEEDDDSNN